ncbi:MAG: hypothetical protein M5R36_19130 [Deltaproteobacteria bacterium]|nr:hypothetical protein [Deltaproteobacteria bacterium]
MAADSAGKAGPKSPNGFDQQISDDIRALQRSSRWLALLGILAVVLLVLLVVFSVYDKTLINASPSFIDIAFVSADDTKLYEGPGEMFTVLDTYAKGDPVFLMEKRAEWARVQRDGRMG